MKCVFCLMAFLAGLSSLATPTPPPRRLLFLVFDQMRPDYVERFDLKNFKRLQKMGTFYKNAYVGDNASITVVSHLVMTTGLFPKDLPWADDVYFDDQGLLGEKNKIYKPMSMSQDQLLKILRTIPASNSLVAALDKKLNRKSYVVGQKQYATLAFGGAYAQSITYMENTKGVCRPAGLNVPSFISANKRYEINCSEKYGTENSFYGLDGNRFYPGKDPAHLGGDIWVADAALDIMHQDPAWGSLYLTFGSIDKFGHMIGETDGPTPLSFTPPAHLADIARIADRQLGRILDELEAKNLLRETLIVQTADHGGQTEKIYLGSGSKNADPFWIAHLRNFGGIKAMTQDTQIRIWLEKPTPENLQKMEGALREVSKLTAIYKLVKGSVGDKPSPHYEKTFSQVESEPKAFRAWSQKHDEELVSTMASEKAPDLVGLLADDVGFSHLGDHGGSQEKVQRIPLTIYVPGQKARVSADPVRLKDIFSLVEKSGILP